MVRESKRSFRSVCALTLIGMLGVLFLAFGTSVFAASDGVYMDFGNYPSLSILRTWDFTNHGQNSYGNPHAGAYEFATVDGMQVLKLNYAPDSTYPAYRVMPKFKYANKLTSDHKYMRITYMTTSDEAIKLTVTNNGNSSEIFVFEDDTSVSNGAFVTTDVVKITDSMVQRLNNPQHVTFAFHTDDPDCEIYIKEIAFFTSYKQAYDTYGDAEKWPVIMDFGDTSETEWFATDHGGVEGDYHHTVVDGIAALELDFDPNSFGAYRVMPKFKVAGRLTAEHKYVRVTYMTTDSLKSQLSMRNNGNSSDFFVLTEDASVSKGQWVRTNAIEITDSMVQRFNNPQHCTLAFDATNLSAKYYLRELAFFTSEEAAYEYYGDEPLSPPAAVSKMHFDECGNAVVRYDDVSYGTSHFNESTGAVDITYAETTNHKVNGKVVHYMAKVMFKTLECVRADQVYVRVLYAADHPSGVTSAVFQMRNDKSGAECVFESDMVDTNGEFVLSPTAVMDVNTMERLAGVGDEYNGDRKHISLHITTPTEGGTYSVKALYFFDSKDAADNFVCTEITPLEFTINGNRLSNYQIVIAENAPYKISLSARSLQERLQSLTRIKLPIVTDAVDESPYEILVGYSSRELSYTLTAEYDDGVDYAKRYCFAVVGDTLAITGNSPYATAAGFDIFYSNFLFKNTAVLPESADLDEGCTYSGIDSDLINYTKWGTAENTDDPVVFSEPFYYDRGYFTEESGKDDFKISGGVISASAENRALTYVHVYEKNASVKAEFTYDNEGGDADFGLMLRYTAEHAYVRAGYSFERGEWYISFREGIDFCEMIRASLNDELEPGRTYELSFTADGTDAMLYVNGELMLTAEEIYHTTPGRVAIYAEDISVEADNFELVLLSGQGTVMRNVCHTLLPVDSYIEGGTVVEMSNGLLNYTHHSGYNFKSADGGKTWEETSKWTEYKGRPQLLRLTNGKLLKIASDVDGYYSYISEDDGETWEQNGFICDLKFRGNSAISASNMNDKVTQGKVSGRIYYSQNYECSGSTVFDEGGYDRVVFCEFFYSDNLGVTWHKSNTSSWTIEGNEDAYKFGECKLLECADGTVRVYSSWADYGCIVYSESKDGGKTFGPLQKMTDFKCSRSSMQFALDPNGETDTTYYMVWVNSFYYPLNLGDNMPRAALCLAKTTDGKNWEYIGDIWRWESNYMVNGALLNHIVDPFITVTENRIICGTGLSEHLPMETDNSFHGAQRQHIWSIDKSTLGVDAPVFIADADGDNATTLVDLAVFNRYMAKWIGYGDDVYNFELFDLNSDGSVNPLDSVVLARHIANWIGYEVLPLGD